MAQSPHKEHNKMKTVKVRILDHDYFIRSNGEIEEVQRVAEYVNEKLNEVKNSTEGLSEKKIAILTALNIAGEYLEVLDQKKAILDLIEKRAKGIISQIDDVVGS